MSKRYTQEEAIAKFRAVHGDKYDYSKVEYKGNKIKVCVICPIHGEFWISPSKHFSGQGCRKCSYVERIENLTAIHKRNRETRLKESNKTLLPTKKKEPNLVFGVGISDMLKCAGTKEARHLWYGMLNRCYRPSLRCSRTYQDCYVCDEWLTFSNFYMWYKEKYVEGYHIDKDILIKGNKMYSPDTCCFVPPRINTMLINRRNYRGNLPVGVTNNSKGFSANLSKCNKYVHVGTYNTPEEAFQAYKQAKEAYIKEVAQEYYDRGEITKKVYDALMRYEVEITD